MKKIKGLEEKIKEKVSSLLEESMEKHWGINIPKLGTDITDKIEESSFNIYLPLNLPFSKAKKKFKAEFLKKELKVHKGNISQLARMLGVDRRSVHRAIKDLDINVEKLRTQKDSLTKEQEILIDQTIRSTLDQYKELIQPQKMERMYEEVQALSRNIAQFIPHQEMTWKEAETEFEKQFFSHVLEENNWRVSKTAERIKLRPETLHRKIKKLGLKEI